MKLLVVADLHYALPQFDWVVAAAPQYDAVIIAGDLLDTSSMVDPGTQILVVLKYIERLRGLTRLLVCSGNHDLDALDGSGEKHAGWLGPLKALGIPSDGETTMLGDMLVTVCPWWDGPASRDAIGAQLAAAAARRTGKWLWVYHAPPPDTAVSWGGTRHFGDPALGEWVAQYRPDIVFAGHVHEAPFSRGGSWVDRIGTTWVFNAGRQTGPVPTTIALDTAAGEAAWFSLEGAEIVRLAEPLVRPVAALSAMPAWMT